MSVEIILKCDGMDCCNDREIYADTDKAIEEAGWFIDYQNGMHYCPGCTPAARAALAEMGE